MAVFPGLLIPKVATCFVCKQGEETVTYFFRNCYGFKENLDFVWERLKTKSGHPNPIDGNQIVNFITILDQHYKMLLLSGGPQLPFDNLTASFIKRLVAAAVGKMYKIHTEKSHELGGPYVTD